MSIASWVSTWTTLFGDYDGDPVLVAQNVFETRHTAPAPVMPAPPAVSQEAIRARLQLRYLGSPHIVRRQRALLNRFCVVDRERRLVGIVSLGDLAVDTDDTRRSGERWRRAVSPRRT